MNVGPLLSYRCAVYLKYTDPQIPMTFHEFIANKWEIHNSVILFHLYGKKIRAYSIQAVAWIETEEIDGKSDDSSNQ